MALRSKWIVGLDLHPSGVGALRFAKWLAEASDDALVGIHVLEESYLRAALKYHHLDELVEGATTVARKALEDVGAAAAIESLGVLQGSTPSESLEAAHAHHAAEGLILGRQAKKEGRDIFRLGRVARRLLRRLPGPTFVIPPDYDPAGADGPVVAAVSLQEDCDASVAFALALSKRTSRPLVLLHVVPTPDDYAAHYLPEASLAKMREDNRSEAVAELESWAADRGCADAEKAVSLGGVVSQTVRFATERRATALVAGSRRLSTFERLLLTSIASELAAMATCPVAVVPPRS